MIQKLAGFEYYVRDLERARRFYVECMGFAEVGSSLPELERTSLQLSRVFQLGNAFMVCSSPLAGAGSAARYLSRHPDGIASLVFEVADIRGVFARLEQNGATPTAEIE